MKQDKELSELDPRTAGERERLIEEALRSLIIDANRLCDRNQGGTYEEDCRRALAVARSAIAQPKAEAAAAPRSAPELERLLKEVSDRLWRMDSDTHEIIRRVELIQAEATPQELRELRQEANNWMMRAYAAEARLEQISIIDDALRGDK